MMWEPSISEGVPPIKPSASLSRTKPKKFFFVKVPFTMNVESFICTVELAPWTLKRIPSVDIETSSR